MARLNIKFADGNQLESYSDDSWSSSGCPTCDYGSKYVNELEIYTTNYDLYIVFNQMYHYAFSTADAIRIFAVDLSKMTEEEFIQHIDTEVHKFDALETYRIKPRSIR